METHQLLGLDVFAESRKRFRIHYSVQNLKNPMIKISNISDLHTLTFNKGYKKYQYPSQRGNIHSEIKTMDINNGIHSQK